VRRIASKLAPTGTVLDRKSRAVRDRSYSRFRGETPCLRPWLFPPLQGSAKVRGFFHFLT